MRVFVESICNMISFLGIHAFFNACLLNAVCLCNVYVFFTIEFCKFFLFSCFVFGLLSQFIYLRCYFTSYAVL